jgi:arsenate reductase (thioredoxin)
MMLTSPILNPNGIPGARFQMDLTKEQDIKIVFVCVENSCRSQMAEAFAHLHFPEGVSVYSSGSRPSGKVNSRAVEFMREIGYDLQTHRSKGLHELPPGRFEYAITMGCGDECPLIDAVHREDWGIPDPKEMSAEKFREIRDLIEARVKELVERIRLARNVSK